MTGLLWRWTHAALRIGAGVLFMQHGLQKLAGWFGGIGPDGATVPLGSMLGIAGALEIAGGILLIIGLATRPVAVVLMLQMIAAYFIAHVPQGGWPIQNQGELALLYGAVFLFLAGHGAGPMSIDAMVPASKRWNRRHMVDRRLHAA